MAAYLKLVLSESDVNIVNNTSKVTAKLYYYGNGASFNYNNPKGTIKIDGTSYSFSHDFTTSASAQLLATKSKIVTHNDDGSKTVSVSASFKTGVSLGTMSTSKSITLTTIPRVSDLSISVDAIPADGASSVIATTTKKSTTFTDVLTISLGDYSQEIESGIAFTIPEEWNNAISGTSAIAKVKVETFNETTSIGSKTVDLTITVPETVVPVINDVAITEAVAMVTNAFGNLYVQNLSQLNVSIDASGAYSSTIKSYSAALDGVTYIQQAFTSNVINAAGILTMNVEVIDSRGRTASKSVEITVVEYIPPTITSMVYVHCDPDGTQNSSGECTKVTVAGSVSSVNGKNTKALKLKYKPTTDEAYTERVVTISDWTFSIDVIINDTDPSMTYEYIAELTDKINTDKPETYKVTTGIVVVSRKAGGTGVTFGGEAESDGLVSKWEAVFEKDVVIKGNLTAPNIEGGGSGGIAQETDPTVPSWAKQPSKPTYTAAEVGALPNTTKIPAKTSDLTNDSGYVTDSELTAKGYAKQSEVDGLSEEIVNHEKNTTLHVTSAEKQVWNGKANKTDIPALTQEAGDSESLVMSQAATTKLVEDALAEAEKVEYETVNSVAEMTDKSKSYVLSSTGTLWAYGETTVEVEPPNKLVPSKATLNQRLSGSSGTVSANSGSVGSFVTDFISVSDMNSISPYNTRLNWELLESNDNKVVYYNSSKARIASNVLSPNYNYAALSGETVIDIKAMYSTSTAPTWADVAYLRFQLFMNVTQTSLTSADIADKTITFDHEGGTKTESAWYDTGIAPSSGGGAGGNYVTLLVKVNENTSNIAEVSERVTALETGSETLTIPTFWQTAVEECIAKIKALQAGRNCITFPFFSDNHQRNGYAGMLIAYIMKECNIPYCIYGGDSISSGTIVDEAEMIEQDKAFDTIMSYVPNGRLCRAVGNHDGYWYDGTNKFYYTREQVYELFLREESIAQNKHFGEDGTYYYVDDIASKTRFIVLNTNGGSVDSTQISWLQNTALSFDETGWAVVFISHQPITNHYHANIGNANEVRTVVINYINGSATNKADVVGWYSGHIHRDRIYTGIAVNTSDDSVGTALPFKQVTITSDHTGIAYDDSTKHTVANDDQSHAIDFVTINKTTRTVNITRLGIGNDRSYTY